jgi:hypothetical protein
MKITPEMVHKWQAEALDAWLSQHATEAKVKQMVTRVLDQRLDEIIRLALGFSRDAWSGKWEVDHCNGRAGESAAGKALQTHAKEAVDAWLKDAMSKVTSFTEAEKKMIRKEYTNHVLWRAKEHAQNMARQASQKLVDEILKETPEPEAEKKEIV